MNVWEWFTATANPNDLVTALGLGALAVLFATNRIITRGQHLDRIADLKGHHERELESKDQAIAAMDESRLYWRKAADTERARADTVTAALAEYVELGRTTTAALRGVEMAVARHGGEPDGAAGH